MNSFLTNHHNSRAYAILFTWIKIVTLSDYCGIDIQPVKFGTPNAPQFDIDPYMGTTFALRQSEGTSPVSSEALDIMVRIGAIYIASQCSRRDVNRFSVSTGKELFTTWCTS